jgi:multiple sugar transport system ATP-binding protein
MATVELDKINKIYENGFHAVQDLSIDVADGEFLVLVGPSGCGKSTALRMVAGLEDISTGDLLIGGRRVNDVDPQGRDIAMVFQSYALYPHMSVRDNIAYGLKLRKMPKDLIEQRIAKAAGMLELTPLLDRKPKQLSGGQRQRVAMGRSIVREPQVFLMDEPLSNLDAKLRVQMRAEISAVVRSLNTTTLYVTHDQTEAMTMGDRMAVMKAGILNQLGSPTDCYDAPVNIFVAQFVGSPPMNLVVVKLEEGPGGGLQIKGERSTLAIPDSVLSARPALKSYVGKSIVVGIRSEDMEDASLARDADPLRRLAGKVTLTEALGSELVVHFTFPGERFVTADTKLIEKETGAGDELHIGDDLGIAWVASFGPRSRVRMGDDIEVVIDVERIHYFDPDTSQAIWT